jgi:hypothetical protein
LFGNFPGSDSYFLSQVELAETNIFSLIRMICWGRGQELAFRKVHALCGQFCFELSKFNREIQYLNYGIGFLRNKKVVDIRERSIDRLFPGNDLWSNDHNSIQRPSFIHSQTAFSTGSHRKMGKSREAVKPYSFRVRNRNSMAWFTYWSLSHALYDFHSRPQSGEGERLE